MNSTIRSSVNAVRTFAVIAISTLVIDGGICAAQGQGEKQAASQQSPFTQNVNVVNTPAVTVTSGSVNIANSPTVTVGNTATNPVKGVDVEKLARIPYSFVGNFSACPSIPCGLVLPGTPTGYRLVVQHVSAGVSAPTGTSGLPYLHLYDFNNTPIVHGFFPGKLMFDNGSFQSSVVNEDALLVFDSTTAPGIDTWVNTFGVISATVSVTGYLENCLVTGCPAIVH